MSGVRHQDFPRIFDAFQIFYDESADTIFTLIEEINKAGVGNPQMAQAVERWKKAEERFLDRVETLGVVVREARR